MYCTILALFWLLDKKPQRREGRRDFLEFYLLCVSAVEPFTTVFREKRCAHFLLK
jgi:hypothetical protein